MEVYIVPTPVCKFLNLKHIISIHHMKEKHQRIIQYIIKDRTQNFDNYFPCNKKNKCKLEHVVNWFQLFVD